MKSTALLLSFIFFILQAEAQNMSFKWAKQIGGTGSSGEGSSIVTDAIGNVYSTGHFSGTVDFDPGPDICQLTSTGLNDMFISKLDAGGNFVWAKHIGGPNNTDGAAGTAITLDADGNILITGYFTGSVDFDPGICVYILSSAHPNSLLKTSFVLKLTGSGNFTWAKQLGGNGDGGSGVSIITDNLGNVYTGGYFGGLADFDPGPGVYSLYGGRDNVYISKLDRNGNFSWATAPKMIAGIAEGSHIALDKDGNIYCTGNFTGTINFDPSPGSLLSNFTSIDWDVYLWKLNSNGQSVWAKQLGGPESDGGTAITVDQFGNIYSTGTFRKTVDFDPGPAVFNLEASGTDDMYLLKLNTDGEFIWAQDIGGTGFVVGNSIVADALGNIYTTGYFKGTIDFDPGYNANKLISMGGDGDMFMSKLNADGNLMWAKQSGGALGSTTANAIAVDMLGNIYTTGVFSGAIGFSNTGDFNLNSGNYRTIFVSKMSGCTASTASTLTATTCKSYTLNDHTYTSSGTYTQTIFNAAACDSIITLQLTIDRINTAVNVTACGSYTWHCHSSTNCDVNTSSCITYYTSGIYPDTITTKDGRDSIVTLYLTINHSYSDISRSICYGKSYAGYSSSGIYIDTLMAANGCDSIRTLRLTVMPKLSANLGADTTLCVGDSLRLYPGEFTSYNWQDGSSKNYLNVKQAGVYSVTVTGNCGSSTDQIKVQLSDCYIYFPSAFTPNNDGKNDSFKIIDFKNISDYHLVVYNRWGLLVFETRNPSQGWQGSLNGKLQEPGIYAWQCSFKQSGIYRNRKGTVMLIR